MKKKSVLQVIWDFIGIPFRFVLFDQKWLPKLGWTTLEEERTAKVLPYVEGNLLDIGAGFNPLVKAHGQGVGVDVHPWTEDLTVVENTADLPFEDSTFDTITFVACLNHIPYRLKALEEARRLITPSGKLIITMINPILGDVGHWIWWYSEDKERGGMEEGEVGGMWTSDIVELCQKAGFELSVHERFQFGLNNLYIFEPIRD